MSPRAHGWVTGYCLGWVLAGLSLTLQACSSGTPWAAEDTTAATHAVQLAKGCEALCLSDAGCTPLQAAACLDAIGCNMGSALHRHGAPALVAPDAGCQP